MNPVAAGGEWEWPEVFAWHVTYPAGTYAVITDPREAQALVDAGCCSSVTPLIHVTHLVIAKERADAAQAEADRLRVDAERRFTMREIVQALTQHYKDTTGDNRHVPATITATETARAMMKIIDGIRDTAIHAAKTEQERGE